MKNIISARKYTLFHLNYILIDVEWVKFMCHMHGYKISCLLRTDLELDLWR